MPDVNAAGATSNLPLSQTSMAYGVYFQEDDPNDRAPRAAQFRAVSHDYLPALGVPLLRGRWFEERDDADAPPVALVNEAFARRSWPDRDPIGQRIALTRGRERVWREIGVRVALGATAANIAALVVGGTAGRAGRSRAGVPAGVMGQGEGEGKGKGGADAGAGWRGGSHAPSLSRAEWQIPNAL